MRVLSCSYVQEDLLETLDLHISPGKLRRWPLACIIGSIFGAVATNTASALTLLVTDCTDGPSSGTLRNTIAAAPDSSIIQIPLMCSKITLTQGHINIPYTINNMYIVGQGPSATVIDGGSTSSPAVNAVVFDSEHLGTLGFSQLTITHANHHTSGSPRGGCVYALLGSVGLNNVVVSGCEVSSTGSGSTEASKGGGVFAGGSVNLINSIVSDNVAIGGPGQKSLGGGIYAKKGVSATSSTISGNIAISGANGPESDGGGFYAFGDGNSSISKSTISYNRADQSSAFHISGNGSLSIVSSTIANNVSSDFFTASSYMPTTVTNSTIAFNSATTGGMGSPVGLYSSFPIEMNNSIFANNVSMSDTTSDVGSASSLNGSNNLITATVNDVPLGTLSSCPKLGHLSNNGGPTLTIPLLKGSPAIDVGAANGKTTDQRGTGFPRPVGSGADIGAYERQAGVIDDVIFYSGFDSRCN